MLFVLGLALNPLDLEVDRAGRVAGAHAARRGGGGSRLRRPLLQREQKPRQQQSGCRQQGCRAAYWHRKSCCHRGKENYVQSRRRPPRTGARGSTVIKDDSINVRQYVLPPRAENCYATFAGYCLVTLKVMGVILMVRR